MADSEPVSPFRLGVLASHDGTNFQSILDRCLTGEIPAQVSVVISNNSRSGAVHRALQSGINTCHLSGETHPNKEDLDQAITQVLCEHQVDLVVLAGYMKKLGQCLLETFKGRVINIHPSLLPAFGGKGMYGKRVHQAVLDHRCAITGVTVHMVDGEYDHGQVIAQEIVPVLRGDTADTLARRVLQMEHRLYPSVVRRLARGQIRMTGHGIKTTV
ncbi:MAG: phosphoribosylglycinamide formyltransferase [Candidatus Latescibacterota bacterium]